MNTNNPRTTTRKTLCILVAATLAIAAATALSGCVEGVRHPEEFPTSGQPSRSATSNPQDVTASDFGHSWNLKVDHGSIACTTNKKGDPVLTFTAPDGTIYALNAVEENNNHPDISDIADGSVGTLRTYAFTVCNAK